MRFIQNKFIETYGNVSIEKMPVIKFLTNIFKLKFPTYNWFCEDGSHINKISSLFM